MQRAPLRPSSIGAFVLLLPLAAAVGCSSKELDAPCANVATFEGCGAPCSASQACLVGLYCDQEGECTADCTATEAGACNEEQDCSTTGRCIPAGSAGSVEGCPAAELKAERRVPNVVIILDGSGSMVEKNLTVPDTDENGEPTTREEERWKFVKEFLIGEDGDGGFLSAYGVADGDALPAARFSLAVYGGHWTGNGNSSSLNPNFECPQITTLDKNTTPAPLIPKAGNVEAIAALLEESTPARTTDTPTGPAIASILENFSEVPEDSDPTIFLLATDGEPDSCRFRDPSGNDICEFEASCDEASYAADSFNQKMCIA